MADNAEVNEILNDLILINNDRIAGYEKSFNETKEIENDLRAMFHNLADQSRQFARELRAEVSQRGGEPETGTLASGKLYRVWMDIRSVFTTDNRLAVLENAEGGEDAAVKAYEEALRSDSLPEDLKSLIVQQFNAIQNAHDTVKTERNRQRDNSQYPLTT